MKDLYSFDTDEAAMDRSYRAMHRAYQRIFARCGLSTIPVEADSGAIGGKESVEFIMLADSGEDQIVRCAGCDYAANLERAAFVREVVDEPPEPLEEVETPGIKTIEDLATFLDIPQSRTLKAVFYSCTRAREDGTGVTEPGAGVRGDPRRHSGQRDQAHQRAQVRRPMAGDRRGSTAGGTGGRVGVARRLRGRAGGRG